MKIWNKDTDNLDQKRVIINSLPHRVLLRSLCKFDIAILITFNDIIIIIWIIAILLFACIRLYTY